MENVRKFALVIIDDFDNEIDRFNLDYVESPKNLGFEMEFTTLESRLTTYFTSAREKKIATSVNVNFLPPLAYQKANAFKLFVQKYMSKRVVFEYNDTTGVVKNWEGKVQKLGQEELTDWQGLVCPMLFLPGTPKFIKKNNAIQIKYSSVGKNYPYKYPYCYGQSQILNNEINNDYFDEIPLQIFVYGAISNPRISLLDAQTNTVYSTAKFNNLYVDDGEHILIDAVQSKVLLYRDGAYISAYDYLDKSSEFDSFLLAKRDTISKLTINLDASQSGYLKANYRQYVL